MAELSVAILCILGLVAGTLMVLEFGRRVGKSRLSRLGANAGTSVGAIEGAVFALLGLLLAFTFSGAATRFDARRELIVEEANNLGTAYLRIDLLPAEAQPALRESFRRYADARIRAYRKLPDLAAARADLDAANRLQESIWSQAVAGCRASASPATTTLLLPAINDVIDVTTKRTVAARTHPPAVVFYMLLTLVLAGSFLAGHGMATAEVRSWLHMLCFAAVMSAAVYVILDYEFPRLGMIRVDAFDDVLVEVRQSMR